MTAPGYGRDAPLSADELAAAVAAVRPDWRLVDAGPMPDGSDIVYGVAVREGDGATREAVLKCFRPGKSPTHTPERFLVEVDLLGIVGRETDLPVPSLYGVRESHESAPTPAFLMEYLAGESPPPVTDPAPDGSGEERAADRLLRESGRHLARVHGLRTFASFGELVADPDRRTTGEGKVPAAEPVVRDGHDTWSGRLGALIAFSLDGLGDTRFSDLESGLREYAEERLATLDLAAEAALLHGDYRPGNLLADPETGAVTAVLDWGAAQAGDPRYELAWAVREFSGRAPLGSPVGERVRDALFDAYEDERGRSFDRGSGEFEERQRFYRAVTWITELRWFDYWWGGADESVREERAARLRENAAELR
ncbi:phosphotransferase family protein [Halosimplex pelagicum]|uniref:Phosphotransferase n=1 Tax=Halosimplex pelagicum TaxID=869886 RepID=A0A7D5TUL9_9EURY|nr:phosphotransferase [Halosimplex pelagicum]QLH83372.1 phosphotransferase [Halosimplex pelagicum]